MNNRVNTCDLESCYLCQRCIPEWLPVIAQRKQSFNIKKGQSVFSEGEIVKGIYFVASGIVKVHKRWDSEKELITRFAKKGDIIGHLGLGNDPLYPVSATAISASIVYYIDLDFFHATLNVNPKLTYDLMRFFANELQDSQKSMRNLAHMSVKGRVANTFLQLKNQFRMDDEGAINIDLSRQDIASYSGTTYETLFKVINELHQNKWIDLVGKRIKITNEEQLLKLVQEDSLKIHPSSRNKDLINY